MQNVCNKYLAGFLYATQALNFERQRTITKITYFIGTYLYLNEKYFRLRCYRFTHAIITDYNLNFSAVLKWACMS